MRQYTQHGVGVLFSLIWSSAFIAGKVAMQDLDSVMVLWIRFALCSLLLAPFFMPKGQAGGFSKIAITGLGLGVLNNVVYLGMTFYALNFITPEWVIIIVSCSPFTTSAIAALRGEERLSATKIRGFLVGFAGVVIMTGITGLQREDIWGLLLAFGGMFSFSLGTVVFRERGRDIPLQTVNFWMALVAAFLFGIWIWGQEMPVPDISLPAFAAIVWLVVVTILGMGLWLFLIRRFGAVTAAGYHLFNPVSGLVLAFVFLGNNPQWHNIVGAITTCVGLYMASRQPEVVRTESP